ncbi:sensor domain-containing diguanylate cyclase [Methylobacterium brachythecii]|uniref:diguanylate cyclase n=1 Tax=Methylobacterium brachythecii TaxID=1176177 RepID=A0A7W6ACS2_9HYPH|nr:sensor domain-containing diguanylate cyclase [Methylobacterium brachythecii]MBB3900867.1 diguanylate cyclase (GGDEF)-like protein [Methylobacterium brachythecii]GLS46432.1 two-component system fusion protein [Methylobacterium brachythecii]
MVLPVRIAQALRSARTWIVLGILAPTGMLVLSGLMLLDMRRDAWDKAEQTSTNLLQVIARDIARNVEIFDLSLQAVVENLRTPGIDGIDPAMRQLVLFDRAATARDMGVLLVIDEHGDIAIDASALPPRKANYADRDYFLAHKNRAGVGLYIGQPLISRLTGQRMIPFSRRVDKPDGSFGGVVLGTMNLAYFSHLFDQIGLGQDGAINLYLRDGTRIMRQPFVDADIGASLAGTPIFAKFTSQRSGTIVKTSVRDGIERYYTFTRIADLPLILNVALSTREIEADWWTKALVIGAAVLTLCGLAIALSLLFGRELGRRAAMQVELARLSRTDPLTGLANRRSFEDALDGAAKDARRTGLPVSLLVVDADHFKRYNDRYGHAVGDEVLRDLARRLSASVHRPNDMVCRVGGEEFVLLLPATDEAGALRVADEVHDQMKGLTVPSAGIGRGAVTVSIGVASGVDDPDLFRRADAALYEAKATGRNRTCSAPVPPPRAEGRALRLVSA